MTADSMHRQSEAYAHRAAPEHSGDGEILAALPLQVIELPDGVLLKRGATEFAVTGPGAVSAVRRIFTIIVEGGATRANLLARIHAGQREAIADLLDGLLARRLVVPTAIARADGAERPEDILFWHFDTSADAVRKRLAAVQVSVVGVNELSRHVCDLLARCGFAHVEAVDDPALRGEQFFADAVLRPESWPSDVPPPVPAQEWVRRAAASRDGNPQAAAGPGPAATPAGGIWCVVPTSGFGGPHAFRAWNRLCLRQRWHLFPVLLQDLIGYVGPLVVPYETACYECLRARENSNLANPELRRAAEYHARDGQQVTAALPSMALTIAGFAATELFKFYGQVPQWHAGHLIEINLLAPDLTARRVLRVPRCGECSAMNHAAPTSTDKFDYQDLSQSALAGQWKMPD